MSNRQYYIQVPGENFTVTEEQFNKGVDAMYKDIPDAQVTEITPYNNGDEVADSENVTVVVNANGETFDLPYEKFLKGKDAMYKDIPDAKVDILRNVDLHERAAHRMEEQMQAMDEANTPAFEEYEYHKSIADNAKLSEKERQASMDFVLQHDKEYNTLKAERAALQQQYDNNPYVLQQQRNYSNQNVDELQEQIRSITEEYNRLDDIDRAEIAKPSAETRKLKMQQWLKDAANASNPAAISERTNIYEDVSKNVTGTHEDKQNLRAAKQLLKESQNLYTADKKSDEDSSNLGAMFRGLKDKTADAEFWSTVVASKNLSALNTLHNKIMNLVGTYHNVGEAEAEKILDEELSNSEKTLLDAYMRLGQAQEDNQDIRGWYKAGGVTAESLMFMAEFLVGSGMTNAATSGIVKAIAKRGAKAAAKATTKVGKMATKGAYKLAAGEARALVGGAVQTAVSPSTIVRIQESMNTINDNGVLVDATEGALAGLVDAYIENASEFGLGLVNKLGAMGAKALNKTLRNLPYGSLYTPKIGEFMKRGGIGGFLEEAGEEVNGAIFRTLLGKMTDNKIGNEGEWKEFWQPENLGVLAASFAPTIGFGAVQSEGARLYYHRNATKKENTLRQVLTDAGYSSDVIEAFINAAHANSPQQLADKTAPYIRQFVMDADANVGRDVLSYLNAQSIDNEVRARENKDRQADRDNRMQTINSEMGDQQWWYDTNTREGVIRRVRRIETADGRIGYIVSGNEQDGWTVNYADGRGGFIFEEEIQQGVDNGTIYDTGFTTMDEHLDIENTRRRGELERNRMRQQQRDNELAAERLLQRGAPINIGTEEAPIEATIENYNKTAKEVLIKKPDGIIEPIPFEDAARMLGINLQPMTDAEIASNEATLLEERHNRLDRLNARRGNTLTRNNENYTIGSVIYSDGKYRAALTDKNGVMQDADLTDDEVATIEAMSPISVTSDATPIVINEEDEQLVPGDPAVDTKLPMKSDGTVDKKALWNDDPQLWAEYNDGVNGREDTKQYISLAVNAQTQRIEAVTSALSTETDLDNRDILRAELRKEESRLATLQALQRKYEEEIQVTPNMETPTAQSEGVESPSPAAEKEETENSKKEIRLLTDKEADSLITIMKENASIAPVVELTPEAWIEQFGESGIVSTPIGNVKMGENQIAKIFLKKRAGEFGMILPTLTQPDIIMEKEAPADNAERQTKYLFVKTFIKSDGSRHINYESVTVLKEGMEVSISSHEVTDSALKKEMQNNNILHLRESLSNGSDMYLTNYLNDRPDLVPTSDNSNYSRHTTDNREDGQLLILPSVYSEEAGALSSPTLKQPTEGKDTNSSETSNTVEEKNEEVSENKEVEETKYVISPASYTTKKGKELDMFLVTFNEPLSKEQQRAARELAKAEKGWYDKEQGGFMMRSEEGARKLAETILNNSQAVEEAQPMTIESVKAVNDGDVTFTETENKPETKWQYGVSVDKQTGYTEVFRDARFRLSADSPEEMLEILRNPLNNMQEVLNEVGVTLENKITIRNVERENEERRKREYEELRANGVNGFKIGDRVIYTPTRGMGEPIEATIYDFEEFGAHNPVLDTGMAPVIYEIANWGSITKIEEQTLLDDNGAADDRAIAMDAIGKTFTRMTETDGKPQEETLTISEYKDGRIIGSLNTVGYGGPISMSIAETAEGLRNGRWQEKKAQPKNEGQFGLVSDERMAELKERLRRKLGGQMNIGIDPEILSLGLEIAVGHIDRGIKSFADFAKVMISELGEVIRPYLKAFYNGARDLPEVVESGLSDEMTPYEEVLNFDVANFDKEQEVAQQVEIATQRIKDNTVNSRINETETVSSQPTEESARAFVETVKNDMLSALDNGTKPYKSIVDIRKRAISVGMNVDADGRTDILLQELVEDGLVRAARVVIEKNGRQSKNSYDLICKLYDMQPTIAARSSNRIKMQQYSTPLPMAWIANRFAMAGKSKGQVLEPTAGNGMLVFTVPVEQVHANELDETRLDNLRNQGFAQVTQQDATQPFEGGRMYDVVIANPPFGKNEAKEYDGKSIPGLDPQITINALESMKDDGRAAIIIGGNMEYADNGAIKSMKPFFTYLYDHYNVQGVIDMSGSLYAKQGTTFPTRMILIGGRRSEEERQQSTVYPPVESKALRKAENFEDLYEIINEVLNNNNTTNGTVISRSGQTDESILSRPSGNIDEEGRRKESNEGNRTIERVRTGLDSGLEGELVSTLGDGTENGGRRQPGGRGSDNVRDRGNDGRVGLLRVESGDATERSGSGRRVDTSDTGGSGRVGYGSERLDSINDNSRTPSVRESVLLEQQKRELDTEKLPYRPHNTAFSLESVAPAAMVEAMDRVLSEIEEQNGSIDEYIKTELGYNTIEEAHKALAAEQMDSVAMAIYQMKQGQALIIGDQTGVGKGRQMAALIRWAVRRGERPIFITQKADLFSDIYRDLSDIGSGDLKPFIFNENGAMVDADGNVVYKPLSRNKTKKVYQSNTLPDEYDYVVLTYSQVSNGDEISNNEAKEAAKKSGKRAKSTKNKSTPSSTPKETFLRAIAKDNYLFLDESHTAAGESKSGAYIQSIVRSTKAVTFASATFAKRPDTMPLYAIRTAMSKAKIEAADMIGIIEKGDVTLQEIMSRELTNAGQMVRRERDMSDVVTDWKTITDAETVRRARENYDKTIVAFNAIIKFQEDYVKPMIKSLSFELAATANQAKQKKGTEEMGVSNVPFANKTFNYTKQLMLALKVDAIVDEVDAEIKAGRHPVIALDSTMESIIKDYSPGEVIEEPTFSASLLKGLDTVLQYTVTDQDGKEQHSVFSPKQLGKAGERAYYELREFIRESTSGIFISPIDAIVEKLNERGYKVGEMTGRDSYVEHNDKGEVVVRRRTDKDKKKMQREFNNGTLDVLILNKSAATGISLHASERFKDQRQRTMIIVQPLSDINDYMQMIGRIDRTGQVHRGYYINLGLPVPAENRFLMMLSTKLKSLNANTTTSQDSESNDVEAPDLLNKYGSQVVIEYLRDNPDIYEKMGSFLKKGKGKDNTIQASELDEYKADEDDALKVTGRAALLTTEEQDEFYDDVIRRYNELIKYLNETGSNDLKITVMPLRATTLERRISSEGIDPNGSNPFAKNSYVELVEMDVLRKPMKAEEVRKVIVQVNKGMTPQDYLASVVATINEEAEAKITAEDERYEKAKAKALEDIAKQTEKINGQQKRTDEEKAAAIQNYTEETNAAVEAKHLENIGRITANRGDLKRRLQTFTVGQTYLIPDNLESIVYDTSSPAIFCGYKTKDSKITASTTFAVFATLDGRRRVELKLSQITPIMNIIRLTNDNWSAVQQTNLDNWDQQIPTETRKQGFIMTGNILQAIADTQDERGSYPGQLISYTDMDGNIHDGILMPDKWNASMLKSSGVPIISRLQQIKEYKAIISQDGKVEITGNKWAKEIYLTVPKSKKEGAKYFEDEVILDAAYGHNFYPYRGKLRADIPENRIDEVVNRLSQIGVRVNERTTDNDRFYRIREEEAPNGMSLDYEVMTEHLQELADKLHIGNLNIVTDISTLTKENRKAKGFYDNATGQITIVIPNHSSTFDVEQTLLHEAVAHYGLRQMFGMQFDIFLDNVFNNVDEDVRSKIIEIANKNNYDNRRATEEYLASLAEETDFQNIDRSIWQKIKDYFADMLRKIGFVGYDGPKLTDNELRYILWNSYENLTADRNINTGTQWQEPPVKVMELLEGLTGKTREQLIEEYAPKEVIRDRTDFPENRHKGESAEAFYKRVMEYCNNHYNVIANTAMVNLEVADVTDRLREVFGMSEEDARALVERYKDEKTLGLFINKYNAATIFVRPNASSAYEVMETIFHENLHAFLYEYLNNLPKDDSVLYEYGIFVNDIINRLRAEVDYLARTDELAKERIAFLDKAGSKEEYITYTIANGMANNNVMKWISALSHSQQELFNDFFDRIGYDTEWQTSDRRISNERGSATHPGRNDRRETYSAKREHARAISERLGVEIEIVSKADMPKGHEESMGVWRNGKIFICPANIPNADEAVRTVLHEAVGHEGLRKLVGAENMTNFCMDLYRRLPKSRRAIIELSRNKHGWNIEEAVEEYLAEKAQDFNLDSEETRNLWDVIVEALRSLLSKIGINVPLSERDVRWLVYQSAKALDHNFMTELARATLAHKLGFSLRAQAVRAEAQDIIRDRKVEEETLLGTSAAKHYNFSVSMWKNRLKESGVNLYESLDSLYEAIEKTTGKAAKSFEDMRLAENQLSSKGRELMSKWEREYWTPLGYIIGEIVKKTGLSIEDIERYLMLDHALERNEVFSKRDALKYYEDLYNSVTDRMERQSEEVRNAALRQAEEYVESIKEEISNTTKKKELKRLEAELKKAEKELEIATLVARNDKDKNEEEYKKRIEAVNNGTDNVYLEFREKDYSGLTGLYTDYGEVGEYDEITESKEEYQQRLDAARKKKYKTVAAMEDAAKKEILNYVSQIGSENIEELWKAINAATKATLKIRYDSNMISRSQYEQVRDMFKHYVPLRGFAENTASDMFDYFVNSESGDFVRPLMMARGRKSKAASPLGFIGAQASSEIAESVKNEAKLTLYYFINNRPDNNLVVLSDTWYEKTIDDMGKEVFVPVYPPFTKDLSSEDAKKAYEQWLTEMEQKRAAGLATNKTKNARRIGISYAIQQKKSESNEHIIKFYVGGEEKFLFINGNPRAAQAINNKLNIETDKSYQMVFGKVLRWFSSINTNYNPEFWISNLQRDLLFALMSVDIKEGKEYNRAFRKNLITALKVSRYKRNHENGKTPTTTEELYYKEFVENGGVTGYTHIRGNEQWEEELKKMVSSIKDVSLRTNIQNGATNIMDAVDHMSSSIEQISRFAAYMTSRQMGKDIRGSVADAKELTVNFNRKGSGRAISWEETDKLRDKNGKKLNTAQRAAVMMASWIPAYARRFVMFFNASVQGLNAAYQLYKANPKRATAYAASYAIVGFLNAAIHSFLDDDEDEKGQYLEQSDYLRRNNLLLGANGVFLRWALPQEMRVFYAWGDIMFNHMTGRSPHKSFLGEMMMATFEAFPFNPSEGWKTFAPTMTTSLIDVYQNKDFSGNSIYRDMYWLDEDEKKRVPKYQMAYDSTSKPYVWLSKAINSIGGDETTAGPIDKALGVFNIPSVTEHLIQSLLGGAGTFIGRTAKTAKSLATWDFEARDIIFLNRVLTISDERYRNAYVNDVYNYYKAEAEHTKNRIKQYENSGKTEEVKKLKNSDDYKIYNIYSEYIKKINSYTDMMNETSDYDKRRELAREQDAIKRKMIKEISELK